MELYHVGSAVKSLYQISDVLPDGLISPFNKSPIELIPVVPGRPINIMAPTSSSCSRLYISMALDVLSKTITLSHDSFANSIKAISSSSNIWL